MSPLSRKVVPKGLKRNFFDNYPLINNKINVSSCIKNVFDHCKSCDNKILIIYFDDMSYSGTQISLSLPDKKSSYNNINIFLGVSFISKIALNRINDKCDINLFPSTILIQSLYTTFVEQSNSDEYDENLRLYNRMIYNESKKDIYSKEINHGLATIDLQQLIYFDHKIADIYSTLQKFIYFGSYPLFNESDICISIPLIKKCKDNNILYKSTLKDLNMCKQSITDVHDEYTCPKTYYKQFDYTYKGQKLEDAKITYSIYNKTLRKDKIYTINKNTLIDGINTILLKFKIKYLKYKNKYLQLKNKINYS